MIKGKFFSTFLILTNGITSCNTYILIFLYIYNMSSLKLIESNYEVKYLKNKRRKKENSLFV